MASASTTQFDLGRVRDLSGRGNHVWYRRVALTLMLALVVAALLGVLGQGETTRTVQGAAATLSVRAPSTVRGGLLWPARVTIQAKQRLVSPQLVLGAGFVRGMQMNTIEPSPTSETSRHTPGHRYADLAFTYPTLEAGDELTVYLQLQSDPTVIGDQDTSVSVESANSDPVRSPATLHVLP